MKHLKTYSGLAAVCLATTYIIGFVFFGGFYSPPTNPTDLELLKFLASNQFALSIVNLVIYVLFGLILSILVYGIYQTQKPHMPHLSAIAALFGSIWVGLVIASGMIMDTGLNDVVALSAKSAEQAINLWNTVQTLTNAIGGGNEIIGGVWLLLISIAGLRSGVFSKTLHYIGIIVGVAGILSLMPFEFLGAIFGLGQIVWFIFIAIQLLRNR